MQQLLQDLTNGQTTIVEAPSPQVVDGSLLINTSVSLISAGTERMLVDFGKANLVHKARQQPDKVKMVLDKVQTNGLMTTIDAVRSKLAQPIALGYSNVGVVSEVGKGVEGFKPGDRVVSNGRHADVVVVAKNLCARIPDIVDDESAAFTVLAGIGLQGVRLVQPTLGEAVVVTGVGLIGLLIVQLLLAQGCRVLAIDFDDTKLELARRFGAEICNLGKGEDPVEIGMAFNRGNGVDAVIIAASTKSTDPVTQAARMSRKRGRIVLVGVTGLELNRADFYEKELTFQVSCSYGPGRYDPEYEDKGNDYPFGLVRWTEQRNFETVLRMMATGRLDVSPLITDRVPFSDAEKAYEKISHDSSVLGVILVYPEAVEDGRTIPIRQTASKPAGKCVAAMIGAGNFAKMTMGPALAKTSARLKYVSARTNGAAASHIAGRYGFENATTDLDAIWSDPEVNTVFITTGHNSHAALVCRALKAGKHVFVEKPLCLTIQELEETRGQRSEVRLHASDHTHPTSEFRLLIAST